MSDDPFLYITTDQLIKELLERGSHIIVGIITIDGENVQYKLDFKGTETQCVFLCEALKYRIINSFYERLAREDIRWKNEGSYTDQ